VTSSPLPHWRQFKAADANSWIAFSLDPNPDGMIEALPNATGPARYAPIGGADDLKMRMNQTYAQEVAEGPPRRAVCLTTNPRSLTKRPTKAGR
jgi:hypothetical protein